MKILLVCGEKITALNYFRQLLPHAAMDGIEFARVTPDDKGLPDLRKLDEKVLDEFHIISFLRQISYDIDIARDTCQFLRRKNKKIIFDIDDFWFVPIDHPFRSRYKEIRHGALIRETLPLADAVTTTTEALADKIRPFNANVHVFPNAIPEGERQFRIRAIHSPLLRFGWIGGVHHLADIKLMKESFIKLHQSRLSGLQVCLGGFNLSSPIYFEMEKVLTDNHRCVRTDADYMAYLAKGTPLLEHLAFSKPYRRLWGREIGRYADLYNDIDVALAPLADNTFNRCKSELKLIEAGWMGKPVIASGITPYKEVIDHGIDGFLVRPGYDHVDWFVFMKKFIENPPLAKEMGLRLQKKIRERFDLRQINEKRLELYTSLCPQ